MRIVDRVLFLVLLVLAGCDQALETGYTPKRLNASDIAVIPRIDNPVHPKVVDELLTNFADFRRAYDEDGLGITEFDQFAPTRRTLRQFVAACGDLDRFVRDVMIPNPDN